MLPVLSNHLSLSTNIGWAHIELSLSSSSPALSISPLKIIPFQRPHPLRLELSFLGSSGEMPMISGLVLTNVWSINHRFYLRSEYWKTKPHSNLSFVAAIDYYQIDDSSILPFLLFNHCHQTQIWAHHNDTQNQLIILSGLFVFVKLSKSKRHENARVDIFIKTSNILGCSKWNRLWSNKY